MRRLSARWILPVLATVTILVPGSAAAKPAQKIDRPQTRQHAAAKHVKAAHRVNLAVVAKERTRLARTVVRERAATWAWQEQMLARPTKTSYHERWAKGLSYLRWQVRLWRTRHLAAQARAQHPPHASQWLCIHGYEGSWTDPGSPYYGGLQMDLGFQASYGADLLRRLGTADHWTPLQQMWVAEIAYISRGFSPWPNTARYCGLL